MKACGVYDLFWWSTLGEMLELGTNPARLLGLGLAANVLGVFLGGILGNAPPILKSGGLNPSVVALTIIFVTLTILPILHRRLASQLSNHGFLTDLVAGSATQTIAVSTTKDTDQTSSSMEAILQQLTEREREVVLLLSRGRTYKMIAEELYLSENTVKTHIKNAYAKLEVRNKTELIKLLKGQRHQ